jgi:hypothetical protein
MKSPRCAWLGLASAVFLANMVQPLAEAQAAGMDAASILLHHPADVLPVRMAVASALYKLGKPACQQVLNDFKDTEGHSLRENLESLGLEPSQYLALIVYRDGGDLRSGRCRSAGAAAVTHPGDRVVYICGANFRAQTPGTRANTLIHEMLHSLGLRENPPSSDEINGQVRKRCGN